MPVSSLLPEPSALGLPSRFVEWRLGQEDAALRAVESTKRFVVLALPTGSGKSLAYLAAAMLSGERTAFLTSTRGLQGQLQRDFTESGLFDIRGQNNYQCLYNGAEPRRAVSMALQSRREPPNASKSDESTTSAEMPTAPYLTCDEGPCHGGVHCALKKGGCTYYDAVTFAKTQAALVSTNYSYWMHQNEHGGGLGPFGMLVLDEAHDAIDQLSNYLAVELYPSDLELVGQDQFPDYGEFGEWKQWAETWRRYLVTTYPRVFDDEYEETRRLSREELRRIKAIKRLWGQLKRLSEAKQDWVFQVSRRGPWGGIVARFDPVWPADYAEKELFRGIKRVVLTSATIRPKTLELLGVDRSSVDFQEYPSSFPVDRRPVYFIPSVRMDKRATPEHMRAWISKIDAIIRPRLHTKGIIHTVSYKRMHQVARMSEFSGHMLVHDTGTTQETIAKFKQAKPPCILVSPSVGTGFDFPDDLARWQIIAKLPFPDSRDLVLKARTERDKDFPMYVTMMEVVQQAGRIVRSESDFGETFIVDSHFGEWFWYKYKKFAPDWFSQAVRFSNTIPKPISR